LRQNPHRYLESAKVPLGGPRVRAVHSVPLLTLLHLLLQLTDLELLYYKIAINALMIYMALSIMFLMRVDPIRGQVGGGWAL
jgi:hypothetical protein